MGSGVERITAILNAASGPIAAIVVPRHFARKLIDELYPESPCQLETGIVGVDIANTVAHLKSERERSRYDWLINCGGYVGRILGRPMIVANDVVICSLSKADLIDNADRLGVSQENLDEIFK